MVDGVALPPMAVGGQGQHADGAAEPVVGPAAAEERAVAAIVLDHEQAHQEPRRRDGQEQGQPVAVAEAEPHQEPQGGERHGGGAPARPGCGRGSARGRGPAPSTSGGDRVVPEVPRLPAGALPGDADRERVRRGGIEGASRLRGRSRTSPAKANAGRRPTVLPSKGSDLLGANLDQQQARRAAQVDRGTQLAWLAGCCCLAVRYKRRPTSTSPSLSRLRSGLPAAGQAVLS